MSSNDDTWGRGHESGWQLDKLYSDFLVLCASFLFLVDGQLDELLASVRQVIQSDDYRKTSRLHQVWSRAHTHTRTTPRRVGMR